MKSLALACLSLLAVPLAAQTYTQTGSTGGTDGSGSGTATVTITSNTLNSSNERVVSFDWTLNKTAGVNEVGIAIRAFNDSHTMISNTNHAVLSGPTAQSSSGSHTITSPPFGSGYVTIRLFRTASINGATITYADPVIATFIPAETEKKVRVAGDNEREVAIRIYLVANDDDIIGYVEAGPGAVYDQTFTIPTEFADDPLKLLTFVKDEFSDGIWIEKDEFDIEGGSTQIGETEVEAELVESGEDPEGLVAPIGDGPGPSAQPTAQTSRGPIWRSRPPTTDDDRLDKATFREGTDAVISSLNKIDDHLKKDGTMPTFNTDAAEPPEAVEYPLASTKATAALPTSAPTFFTGTIGKSSVFAVDIPFPAPIGTKEISYDLSEWDGFVDIFRALLSVVLWIYYFLLMIKTLRSSSAG